jgi:tetratricopeptide (TPR) repeat protein
MAIGPGAGLDYYGLMMEFKNILLAVLPLMASDALTQELVKPPAALAVEPAISAMDGELFYQLLMGELTVANGEAGAGYSLFLDAARKTNDARLYERAVTVALQSRAGEPALQAARAWSKAQPASREANRYVLQILVGLNRVGETMDPLKAEIARSPVQERNATIGTVPRIYARVADKRLAAGVVEQALADAVAAPATAVASWVTIGRMRLDNADGNGVLDAVRRAQAIDSQSEGAAALALSLMASKQPAAEEMVHKYLAGKPSPEIRIGYARILIDAQRYTEATQQLQKTVAEKPDHALAWLLLGSLELQDKKYVQAEKSLKRHVELAQPLPGSDDAETGSSLTQAYLQLAQIAEQRKDYAQAEVWLGRIDNPEELIGAQARRASILARQGRLEEGRKLLRALPEKMPSDGRLKLMAEVQLLREFKQFKPAYELLVARTKSAPPDWELLYDQAMLAEKIGDLPEMERLLRYIISGKPDYLHAYNALGYSYADRNIRLADARNLIAKALELAPNDPFITDSLGWVEFRIGNTAEAARILESAFKSRPDAEIAAHWGEVLWVSGKREQALSVWRDGIALNAENETLQETLRRLRVKL